MNSIIFAGWEVLATLDSRKRCFTRPLRPQPQEPYPDYIDPYNHNYEHFTGWMNDNRMCIGQVGNIKGTCHWNTGYKPGQEVFVRETWARVPASAYRTSTGVTMAINPNDTYECAVFKADWERVAPYWLSPAIAPEWASRLHLTITEVKVRRVQEITEDEALQHAVDFHSKDLYTGPSKYMSGCCGMCEHFNPDTRAKSCVYGSDITTTSYFPTTGCWTSFKLRESEESARFQFANKWTHDYWQKGLSWESNPFVFTCWFDVK